MLTSFINGTNGLERAGFRHDEELDPDALWIDLVDPGPAERGAVEKALSVHLPSRDQMEEIEVSSRFVRDGDALFLTASVVYMVDTPSAGLAPVTFVLKQGRLVTLRYADPQPIRTFPAVADRQGWMRESGETMLVGMLDAIAARAADLLEKIGVEVDRVTSAVFSNEGGLQSQSARLEEAMQRIGRAGDLLAKSDESLHSVSRLVIFLQAAAPKGGGKEMRARLKVLSRDLISLTDHARALSQRINFLLDATLGVLNIQQNGIIKLFSVVSVALMPPTLIASIYGMNFRLMPELDWAWGYPYALGLMVVSAILPFVYFKRRGWL